MKPKPRVTKDKADGGWYVRQPMFGFARASEAVTGPFPSMRAAAESVLRPSQSASGSALLYGAHEPRSSKDSRLASRMWPAVYR